MSKIDSNTLAKMQELMKLKLQDAGVDLKDTKPVFPLWTKDKVNALKNLQVKITDIENKFFEDIQDLERKYMAMFNPLYDERMKIVTGEKATLTEAEKKWDFADECIYEETPDDAVQAETTKNLPDFWLNALKSTKMMSEMILEHDEAAFEKLTDVRCNIHEQKPYGYTIEFHFDENEFFSNRVLTKTYELICDKDENRPFLLARGHFYKCKGCTIDWKKGKDLNFKIVKIKQKNKKTKVSRVVTKEEEQDTFFTFFNTPNEDGIKPSIKQMLENKEKKELKEDEEEEAEDESDLDAVFEMDFEICRFLKETFIPKAVLYYTGELVDEDYDDDYEDEYDSEEEENNEGEDGVAKEKNDVEDEDDEEEEEEEDEEDSADDGKKIKKTAITNGDAPRNKKNSSSKSGEPTPNECKQN
jgi:hypothetical protein